MKQFHDFTTFANKYIDVAVCRIQPKTSYLTTHPIDSDAHIARMLSHNYAIIFIDTEHLVFYCKIRCKKRDVKDG